MPDELSNAAKLAILKYLVTIFVGGFTVFSAGAYYGFIKPLDNLKPSIVNSVSDNVKQILEGTQKKFDDLYEKHMDNRAHFLVDSSLLGEKIKDANLIMDEMEGLLRESTRTRNAVQDLETEVNNIVQGTRDNAEKQAGLNLASIQAEIEELSAEIERVKSNVEGALNQTTVRSDVPVGAEPVTVDEPTKLDEPIELLPCDPLKLTEQQIELVSIEQRVERTETFSSNDRRYYNNIFSVAIRRDDGGTVPGAVGECVLNAVERVDYHLSKSWFTPPSYEKDDPDTNFRFSIKVWGVTSVSAEIHLKGENPTLSKRGRFNVTDDYVTYF